MANSYAEGYRYCTGCQVARKEEGGKWRVSARVRRWRCAICVKKASLSWINRGESAADRAARRSRYYPYSA